MSDDDWLKNARVVENAPASDDWLANAREVEAPTAPQEPSTLDKIGHFLTHGGVVRHGGAIGAPIAFAMNPQVQDLGHRALNWMAGGARTLAAAPFGGVTKQDAVQALKGEAPGLSKYLEQAGVPQGPTLPMTNISARDAGGFVGDLALDPLMYLNPAASLEGKGSKIAAAATGQEVNAATKGLGKYLYKSGLKKVDEEVAKYGKAPVSDILMKERVTGSARSIADRMDELAADRLAKRDQILNAATQAGAETNVPRSLEPAKDYIKSLQAQGDERLEPLISKMKGEVATLERSAGHPEIAAQPPVMATRLQPELFELPVSQTQPALDRASRTVQTFENRPGVGVYEAPTLSDKIESLKGKSGEFQSVINNPADSMYDLPIGGRYENVRPAPYELGLDYPEYMVKDATPKIPRKLSPNPEQMTAMKSNSYSVVGDQGYNEAKNTPLWKRFEKMVASGQKQEVERTVGEALGPQAEKALTQHNDELGRLLTSQEKAEQAARVAGNKNAVTSVDAMIAGANHGEGLMSYLSPMLLLKKAADILKESRFRTNGGLFLNDLGNTQIPAGVYRRQLSKDNSWENVK